MSDLSEERLIEEPPFGYCGVDMFGLFLVKEGRKIHKRYGSMFTCLCSRTVFVEMTTDSFIQALRRLINRWGNIRIIRSDNGSNFIGASTELKRAFSEMDKKKINDFLMELGGEWLIWKHNPLTASNMGGLWEQQIRSVRNILAVLIKQHGESLNDESLRTLLAEVEGIIISRPITCDNIGDVNSIVLLIPMRLLSMKTKFLCHHLEYSRRMICTVENISDEFNTYVMSFGLDGRRKFLLLYSLVRNGNAQNEIFKLEMQCWCGIIRWEISGRW